MGNLMTAPYARGLVFSRTSFQAVKGEVGSRNFRPTICDLGLVFLAEDLGRAFGIPVDAGSGLAPTKMLISLEGAHVFWMSIFGELEQLRQLKAM
jgi:hypothetical protein